MLKADPQAFYEVDSTHMVVWSADDSNCTAYYDRTHLLHECLRLYGRREGVIMFPVCALCASGMV